MNEGDLDDVLSIEQENFDDPWPKEAFVRDLENKDSELIVLIKDDKCIGYYDIWYMFENADISNIAVKKEYQGNKYGEYLLKDLLKRCIRRNIEFVHLEVRIDNKVAINLYKKMGFEQVRIRKGYYNGIDAIDMVKGTLGLSEESIGD